MGNKAEAQLQEQAFDWDFFPYEVQLHIEQWYFKVKLWLSLLDLKSLNFFPNNSLVCGHWRVDSRLLKIKCKYKPGLFVKQVILLNIQISAFHSQIQPGFIFVLLGTTTCILVSKLKLQNSFWAGLRGFFSVCFYFILKPYMLGKSCLKAVLQHRWATSSVCKSWMTKLFTLCSRFTFRGICRSALLFQSLYWHLGFQELFSFDKTSI